MAARDKDVVDCLDHYLAEDAYSHMGIAARRAQVDELVRLCIEAREERDGLAEAYREAMAINQSKDWIIKVLSEHGKAADQERDRLRMLAARAQCGCIQRDCLTHGSWVAEDVEYWHSLAEAK